MKTIISSQFSYWPQSGVILSMGEGLSSLEESESYQFACELLCEHSPRSSALIQANTHPDFFKLVPLEDNQTIKIDQVRELIEWVQAKPQISNRKVALIYPAEALNLQAANALLKTLEEVALDTLFILVLSCQVNTLPETIISRCHIIRSKTIPKDPRDPRDSQGVDDPLHRQVINDLESLQKQQTEPVTLAALWLKQDVNRLLFWVLVVLNDQFCQTALKGNMAGMKSHFTFLDTVYETRRSLQEHDQLNKQLLLEVLLIQFSGLWQTL